MERFLWYATMPTMRIKMDMNAIDTSAIAPAMWTFVMLGGERVNARAVRYKIVYHLPVRKSSVRRPECGTHGKAEAVTRCVVASLCVRHMERGGFAFDLHQRNAALEKNGVKMPAVKKTGTTIAGVIFKVRPLVLRRFLVRPNALLYRTVLCWVRTLVPLRALSSVTRTARRSTTSRRTSTAVVPVLRPIPRPPQVLSPVFHFLSVR